MVAWYSRQKVAPSYRRAYAVVTMTVLAFLNINSLLQVGIRINASVAKTLFSMVRDLPASILLAGVLLVAHMLIYGAVKFTPAAVTPRSYSLFRPGAIAAAYLLISFAMFLYSSRWVPLSH